MAATAKAPSKSEVIKNLAESTGLSKKQVSAVVDSLADLIHKQLGKKGPGVFAIPGLVKLKIVHKEATKARTMPNPFKPGEMMEVKARPARKIVKAMPLKALKDSVS
jgi:nucleoid DNA-binding protein